MKTKTLKRLVIWVATKPEPVILRVRETHIVDVPSSFLDIPIHPSLRSQDSGHAHSSCSCDPHRDKDRFSFGGIYSSCKVGPGWVWLTHTNNPKAWRLRQEGLTFEGNLKYIARSI